MPDSKQVDTNRTLKTTATVINQLISKHLDKSFKLLDDEIILQHTNWATIFAPYGSVEDFANAVAIYPTMNVYVLLKNCVHTIKGIFLFLPALLVDQGHLPKLILDIVINLATLLINGLNCLMSVTNIPTRMIGQLFKNCVPEKLVKDWNQVLQDQNQARYEDEPSPSSLRLA